MSDSEKYIGGVSRSVFVEKTECSGENLQTNRLTIVVLGSGPIRIGQGIEFDYASVGCVRALKKLGYEVAIINNNPETVSTDFDTADRLYFEPLTPVDVMNVLKVEKPLGVVVAFGGGTAIKLAKYLDENGVKILGNGELNKKLTVQAAKFSKSALEKIEAAGGKAEVF